MARKKIRTRGRGNNKESIHHYVIVAPAARVAVSNAWWKANIDPVGGDDTFTVPANSTGVLGDGASHYFVSMWVTDSQRTKIEGTRTGWEAAGVTIVHMEEGESPRDIVRGLGLFPAWENTDASLT